MKNFSLILIFFLFLSPLFSQTEEDFDKEFLINNSSDKKEFAEDKEDKKNLKLDGYIQSITQLSIPMSDSISDYEIIKFEERGRIALSYSMKSFYSKAVVDFFFYPNQQYDESETRQNRIDARELFIKGGETLQFKIGIQSINWGTVDVFKLTNYINQFDLSEALTGDPSDLSRGVPAISLKYLFSDYSIEGIWSPLHNPVILPEGFWKLEDTNSKYYSNEFIDTGAKPENIGNSSFALRLGGNYNDYDIFFTYFNGIGSNLILKNRLIEVSPLNPGVIDYSKIKKEITLEYLRVNSIGFEIATTIEKLSLRFETVFTPDMGAVKKISDEDIDDEILKMSNIPGTSEGYITTFDRVPYIAYTVGGDYNLWGKKGLLLVEWTQGIYLKDFSDYSYPALSYLLMIHLKDNFFDNRMIIKIGSILRPITIAPGGLISSEVIWKFTNNLEISFKGFLFIGNDDELFEYIEDKDMIEMKVRYKF